METKMLDKKGSCSCHAGSVKSFYHDCDVISNKIREKRIEYNLPAECWKEQQNENVSDPVLALYEATYEEEFK